MKGTRWIALGCALALVIAACGRDDDGTADPDEGRNGTTPTDTTPSDDGGIAAGEFGDLGTVCGPGDAEPVEGVQGIDGTTINVATFSDRGFQARPGLNEEFFDMAEAVEAWCNEQGGVRGYRINVNLRDAALAEVPQRMIETCEADFAMVGGGVVFDDTGQEVRLTCANGAVPDFSGFVVTTEAADADVKVQPVPNPVPTLPIGSFLWIEDRFPDTVDRVAVVTGDLPATRLVADRNTEAMETLGWDVVQTEVYSSGGEASWRPFVESLRSGPDGDGVEGIFWVGEPTNLGLLSRTFDDLGWRPQWILTDTNHYDSEFLAEFGGSLQDTFIRSVYWPFEDRDDNLATNQYFELMERYNPDGKIALLGAQGLSAWLLFFTALGECIDAGDISRDCAFETALGKADWTGGGLHAPQDVPNQRASDCYLILAATPDGFVVEDVDANQGIFNCAPENVADLTGDYGEGARCPSGRENPLPSECQA